ncbi:hypothetical protein L0Y65_02085 [Candidatus Micrarchaeota archaeon]|nr:hypothetical protein [Candidatus Micrarchaeota archaeon]
MMAQEKISGGKLVCIEAHAAGGKAARVKITGDFFLHPEDRISSLEAALVGVPLDMGEGELETRLQDALGDGILIGATCRDLARIFCKAVKK